MGTAIRKRGETMAFAQIEDGKGQLECLFFRDAFIEYGAMLSRDRVLVIEGSLSDDDFSGGFSLRAKRCWDYRELCAAGQRLDLRIDLRDNDTLRSEEHTSELQSLMRISYAVFCLKKKKHITLTQTLYNNTPYRLKI